MNPRISHKSRKKGAWCVQEAVPTTIRPGMADSSESPGPHRARRAPGDPETVRLSGSDPLTLVGITLLGARAPAVRTSLVVLRSAVPA